MAKHTMFMKWSLSVWSLLVMILSYRGWENSDLTIYTDLQLCFTLQTALVLAEALRQVMSGWPAIRVRLLFTLWAQNQTEFVSVQTFLFYISETCNLLHVCCSVFSGFAKICFDKVNWDYYCRQLGMSQFVQNIKGCWYKECKLNALNCIFVKYTQYFARADIICQYSEPSWGEVHAVTDLHVNDLRLFFKSTKNTVSKSFMWSAVNHDWDLLFNERPILTQIYWSSSNL